MPITFRDQFATETEAPEAFVPNFDVLNAALASNQAQFDRFNTETDNLAIRALEPDRQRANEIISGFQDRAEKVSETFANQGVIAGQRLLRSTQRDVRRAFRPGGEANQMERNFEAAAQYNSQLDKLFEKGDVQNAEKIQWLKGESLAKFAAKGGTNFNGTTNNFNNFGGVAATRDVDLANEALDATKGWLADQINDGKLKPVAGGQYFDTSKRKFIGFKEVQQAAIGALKSNPAVVPFLRQEAQRLGKSFEADEQGNVEAVSFINEQLTKAANIAAEKQSFSQVDPSYIKNWRAAQDLGSSNRIKEMKFKHELENKTSYVRTISQGRNIPSLIGQNIKDVEQAKDLAGQNAAIELRKLSDSFKNNPEQYAEILEGAGLTANSTPTEVHTAFREGKLDFSNSPYSDEAIAQRFNSMGAELERESIAAQKIKAAEDFAESKTGTSAKRINDEFESLANNELKDINIDGKIITTAELKEAAKQTFFGGSGNASLVIKSGGVAVFTRKTPDGRKEEIRFDVDKLNDEQAEAITSYNKVKATYQTAFSEDLNEFNAKRDEYLNQKNDFSTPFTTNIPLAVGEDAKSAQATLKSVLLDPTNTTAAINESGLSNEVKEELLEKIQAGGKVNIAQDISISEDAPAGKKLLKFSITVANKDGTEARSEEILVDANNYRTRGMDEYFKSGLWEAQRHLGIARDERIPEYSIPHAPEMKVTWQDGEVRVKNTETGSDEVISSREFLAGMQAREEHTRRRVNAGLTKDQYLEFLEEYSDRLPDLSATSINDVVIELENKYGISRQQAQELLGQDIKEADVARSVRSQLIDNN